MKQYLDLLQHILDKGVQKGDRTGTGTISIFGYQMRMDLADGFPLLTTKKLHLKSIIHELIWFLSGETNIKYLVDNDVNIWVPDAYKKYRLGGGQLTKQEFIIALYHDLNFAIKHGNLGPVYGKQWRDWCTFKTKSGLFHNIQYEKNTIDQIANLIQQIKTNPDSRRHLVSAWNVADIDNMTLPPCHYSFQMYVVDNKLSCMFNMRSTDVFLGLPFNIASYALLTMMVANVCELQLGELIFNGGDVHIYNNHIDQVKLQLNRKPYILPQMIIQKHNSIDDFEYKDFRLVGYDAWPTIKGEISV